MCRQIPCTRFAIIGSEAEGVFENRSDVREQRQNRADPGMFGVWISNSGLTLFAPGAG